MCFFFFFNATSTTEIYTLSLHDALPIFRGDPSGMAPARTGAGCALQVLQSECARRRTHAGALRLRSEEHTSELQSRENLVCRLLLEKKKKKTDYHSSGAGVDWNSPGPIC